MEDFTITTRLTVKEYLPTILIGLYKKPVYIICTIFSLYLLITVILDYSNIIDYYPDTPLFEICAGLFVLLMPLLIALASVKQFNSNPNFKNDMIFTFGDWGIRVEGPTFKSEFTWSHIIKQKELGKFLILYHSKGYGNFIDKTKLTPEQLYFIKARVKRK